MEKQEHWDRTRQSSLTIGCEEGPTEPAKNRRETRRKSVMKAKEGKSFQEWESVELQGA